MPYRIEGDEPLASGLRRIAGEQAARGIAALEAVAGEAGDGTGGVPLDTDREDPWDEAVHDARKRCKKARAVARLCRDALGDAYAPANAAFRDAARLLADARDAWTFVEAVDRLAELDGDDRLPTAVAAEARAAVLERYRSVRRAAVAEGALGRAAAGLREAAATIPGWPLPADLAADDLAPSIARVAGRARDRWEEAAEDLGPGGLTVDPQPTTERWHEWRKRVKYLWYQVRLLEPSWPPVLGALEGELDRLADLLGEDHDLAVLVRVLRAEDLLGPGRTEQLAGAAAAQRAVLRGRAAALAPLVHAEDPDALAARLCAYRTSAEGRTRRRP